ncbi:hypothetical protein like AT4G10780 [Hibiscus trionum]|uniref:AAA+ ATPase domain-containing protein n=1 Tax=Hibiscus trionum TaxID=183268 RepID=A0A9W7HIJ1_HIBTR|nr:hypothetical protein like AT4G10780 [Hibiscus trionum]
MEIASFVLEVTSFLCNCIPTTGENLISIRHLQKNTASLKTEKGKLTELRDDVRTRVDIALRQQKHCRNQVDGWLRRVEELDAELDTVLHQVDEREKETQHYLLPTSLWSRYKLGKLVLEKLEDVADLMSTGGHFGDVADMLPPPLVDEMPLGDTVGMDSNFSLVWNYLCDPGVGIIGIYGTGGVGKTTLLTRINNELIGRVGQDYDVVIWAVVSRDQKDEKVQDKIGQKLGFPDEIWNRMGRAEKANSIFRVLKTKRFVLLLDDVWDVYDLKEAGVPVPSEQNKAKVVLTTRREDVCDLMNAQRKLRVNCLAWREAWRLFQSKVGEEVLQLNPAILELAVTIADECSGLPLALITVGQAMRSRTTIEEWRHAATTLRKSAAEFTDMEKKVISLLKFSFDNLPDDTTKSCFLYCALYPEDWYLDKVNLINTWLGEGILDQSVNIFEAYDKGHHIIGTLKLACLLEGVEHLPDNFIKMHDMIRDMALWVISDKGATKGKTLVQVNLKLTKAPAISEWEKAERIFLGENSINELTGSPRCPNLLTLDLRWNDLRMISENFFDFMPCLKLVDLSTNKHLSALPRSFYKLLSLQHLDLSYSGIKELSLELRNLTKLKFLYVNNMEELRVLPQQVLSNLPMLKRLDLFHSGISDQEVDGNVFSGGNELLVDELECLQDLQALSFTVKSEHALRRFSRSGKLRSVTYGLDIELCRGTTILRLQSDMRLSWVQIGNCSDLEEVAIDWIGGSEAPCNNRNLSATCLVPLGSLIIKNCKVLVHLNWLIWVPNLNSLEIANCEAMEKLIGHGDADGAEITDESSVFCNLQTLKLNDLPQLENICSHPLSFVSLREIHVFDCPKLKKLPFHANSAKDKIYNISGQKAWWDGLQWDDMAIKSTFDPYFREH